MVDYRLKITIYNDICDSESITPTVLFQFVSQPTFGFAFLGELFDKYKG